MGADDLSRDTVHDLLSHRRRRHILASLAEPAPPLAVADLAEEVAGREHEVPRAEIPDATVRTIYFTLYHHHLPKLADVGVVEYDRDRMVIRRGRTIDQMERFLSLGSEEREEQ